MFDPIVLLNLIAPTRRKRFLDIVLGDQQSLPSPFFLQSLQSELGMASRIPAFFSTDVELDSLYAAFSLAGAGLAGSSPNQGDAEGPPAYPIVDDRRGLLEQDGFRFDAVAAYRSDGAVHPPVWDLVLFLSRPSGKWHGRRMRRIIGRLLHVFGEEGKALSGVRPRLVALGPERPASPITDSWPSWARRKDGTCFWLPLRKSDTELRILRCDKRGKRRRAGEYWTVRTLADTGKKNQST